jgi:hypothetical protein
MCGHCVRTKKQGETRMSEVNENEKSSNSGIEIREYLNTSDDYVRDVLHIAVKSISLAYRTSYDPPRDLPDGWIGVRIDTPFDRIRIEPARDADEILQRLINDRIEFAAEIAAKMSAR